MGDFQIKAKADEHPEINVWLWYIDDSVLKCKHNKAQVIVDHINNTEPKHIKFIMGEEENNKLAVLDLELNISRKRKKMEFSVQYKKKNTSLPSRNNSMTEKVSKKNN